MAADEAHYQMDELGMLTLEAGEHRVTVNHPSGSPIRTDALVFRPLVMEKLYGQPGERLLLLKSWAADEAPAVAKGDGLAEGAEVRVFDRLANLVSEGTLSSDATLTLPPFGFALVAWATNGSCPTSPGRGSDRSLTSPPPLQRRRSSRSTLGRVQQ